MRPSTTTRGFLNRFLVEDFYANSKKKKDLIKFEETLFEETLFEDFIVINIVLPHHSTFNNLLLSLISIYKDLR